jgi:hypothetical protein
MEALLFVAFVVAESPSFAAFPPSAAHCEDCADGVQTTHAPPATTAPKAATYADARARAIAEGKPLVVWVGGGDALCVPCLRTLSDEAVHWIADSWPNTPPQALIVAMPEAGDLLRVATITQWTTGDRVFGHVPSIRRAIDAWRTRRAETRGGWSMGLMSTYTSVPVMAPQPIRMMQPAPVMMQPMRRPARGAG